MATVPTRFAPVILCFAPLFRQRTWCHAQELLLGAILATGIRTVASVLRVLGRAGERHFVNYHCVLGHVVWLPLTAARALLALVILIACPGALSCSPSLASSMRRCGIRIAAKGIYYDAVRSSHSHFNKAGGLRWRSVMVLAAAN